MDDEVRVARPRVQRLSDEMEEEEAVRLLAGLLVDAAKAGVVMPGAFQRVMRRALPGASPAAEAAASRMALQNAGLPAARQR